MTKSSRAHLRAKRGHPAPYRRADGRWCVTIELGRHPDGRRWRLPVYGRSPDEVKARIPAARARALGVAGQLGPDTPVAAYAAHWLDKVAPSWDDEGRRTGMKHSTWRGYEKHVRLSITPTLLGQTRLDRLTPRLIRQWRDYLGSPARGLGPRSVKYALDTLRLALQHAKDEDEIIATNPAKGVSAPSQQTPYEARIFTLTEARTFLRSIRGHSDEALILVSLFGGPRQGETLSLRRADFDAETGVLTFKHTLDWIDGQASIEENKTATSRRSVRLPSYVAAALRRQLNQLDERRTSVRGWVEYGLLFPGEKGQALRGSVIYHRLHKLLAANGLPILRWHDIRHSSASIMLALGLPMQTVQRLLGHSSLEMISKRYGHLVPELAAEEIAKLERALIDFEGLGDGHVGM